MKKIDGFWAGTEAYKKNKEDSLMQNHREKVSADFIQRLLAVTPKGFTGLLSEMS